MIAFCSSKLIYAIQKGHIETVPKKENKHVRIIRNRTALIRHYITIMFATINRGNFLDIMFNRMDTPFAIHTVTKSHNTGNVCNVKMEVPPHRISIYLLRFYFILYVQT